MCHFQQHFNICCLCFVFAKYLLNFWIPWSLYCGYMSDLYAVCPPSAKRIFLTELFDLLTQEMADSVNNGSFHRCVCVCVCVCVCIRKFHINWLHLSYYILTISTGEAYVLSPFDMKLTYMCVCVCVCVCVYLQLFLHLHFRHTTCLIQIHVIAAKRRKNYEWKGQ